MIAARYTLLWTAIGLLLAGAARGDAPAPTDREFLFLPPTFDDRVIFYHAFAQGEDQPEINAVNARVELLGTALTDGFNGRGLAARPGEGGNQLLGLRLVSPAFSVHRPLTVMVWWRLDAPMSEATWFGLLKIGNHGGRHDGYIANFVAGKGTWCALTQPTYISQLYRFPGMTNRNMPWGGRVWSEPGQWRHVAMTVSGARQVDIYWDGRHREMFQAKGRLFDEGDTNALTLGPEWHKCPMTLDEIVVLDRALTAEEIADYFTAATALHTRFSQTSEPVK